MPEIFAQDPEDDAFALPGDDERIAAVTETAPEPAAEPAEQPTAEEAAPADAATEAADESGGTVPVEAAEPASADDELQAYLDKYGGDTEKALRAAVEAQKLIGRKAAEATAASQRVEQLEALLQEQQRVEAAAQPQYDQDALETWFAENPTRIPELATQAFYQGDETLLDAAIAAWEEIDRPAARRFERQVAVAQARAELHRDAAAQQAVSADWAETAKAFADAHPDLEQVAPKMRELASSYPNIVSVLQTGDPEAKREVLEFLYEKASRGHASDTRAVARDIAREQALEAEEAIREAAVASAATTAPAVTPSSAETIAAEWERADAPYRDGWNV